jgi:hypothetical protein
MRALSLTFSVVMLAVAAPARAQSTATFPEPHGGEQPVVAAPVTTPPAPAYSGTAQPGWGGAAMTAAPVSAPVAGTGFSWGGPTAAEPPYRDQPPPGYELEEHTPSAPIVVGAMLLAVPYATGLGIAGAEGFANGSGWLAVPGLGPWLALASRENPSDTAKDAQEFNSDVGHCVAEPFVRGMLVLDGVLQATGAIVLIVGANGSEKRLVPRREAARVELKPQAVGRSGYGLGVLGSF